MTDKSSGSPPARRRVSSFADDLAEDTKGQGGDDLDQPLNLSGFAPKTADELNTPLDADAIRAAAEAASFASRQPVKPAATAPASLAVPEAAKGQGAEPAQAVATPQPAPPRQPRRRTTGRNQQFNIKATAETIDRFIALADKHGWVYGEAFEHAVAALEMQDR